MKALTAAEMREVDRLTIERLSKPSSELMEAAGEHVAEAVLEEFAPVYHGSSRSLPEEKGNNGGTRWLRPFILRHVGLDPGVCLFGSASAMTGDAGKNNSDGSKAESQVIAVEKMMRLAGQRSAARLERASDCGQTSRHRLARRGDLA